MGIGRRRPTAGATRTAGAARAAGAARTSGAARASRAAGVAAVALAVTAGTIGTAGAVGAPPDGDGDARRPGVNRLEGVWQTNGYGILVEVHGTAFTTYDVTRVSCTPGFFSGAQVGAPGRDGTVRYGQSGKAYASSSLTPRGRDRAVYQEDGAASARDLTRLPGGLPAQCRQPAPQDALSAFDRFWATFEENYPFFAAKGIDWRAKGAQARAGITPQTSTDDLQKIIVDLLEPLGDAHTALGRKRPGGGYTGVFGGLRPGTAEPTDEVREQAARAVAAQLLAPERTFGQGRLGVGELPGGIGYLRVSAFDGYVEDGPYQDHAAELDKALDLLLAHPERLNGLVVDLRLNGGGSDRLGLRIASRLTDRPFLAYRKVARNDPADPTGFTRPQPSVVRPAVGTTRYTGPVALLTAGSTVSAGETFTQAMAERRPAPVRIGENTQGVFSDIMFKPVSADLVAVLPNEKFLTRSGSTFDGPGIPPNVRTPVFTPEELGQGRDSALTEARRILSAGSTGAADTADAGDAAEAADAADAAAAAGAGPR
ncbi:S41 family peptidase [Kitasatospora sp. MBT66]|uniref:S41 family peptidase n=1 Tax=Kitasatospora sp. MBT66 TaxID=1444769 RepID=UPI000690A42A|nr:S41 family peptidase [Kitasatospora sp. MBT66]